MGPLDLIREWPVKTAAAALITADGDVSVAGDIDHRFEIASLTKLMSALAVLVAVEEGSLTLDETVTEAGATTADLLSHAGGMSPESPDQLVSPRTRRIYSSSAYDRLGEVVADRTDMPFAAYLHEGVFAPLRMSASELRGSPGSAAVSTARDLVALAWAWTQPLLVHESTLAAATTPVLAELGGVLPGFGRFDRNLWGLGPEIKGHKQPHWTGALNSAATFGHFGRAGSMMWIDPHAGRTLIALADEPFGSWAAERWPVLSDLVLTS